MMRNCAELQYSQRFICAARAAAALLLLATLLLPLRNTLHAADTGSTAQAASLLESSFPRESSPGWLQAHRMEWFYAQRAFPSGDIPSSARMDAWQQQQHDVRQSLDENWTALGPTNLAGRALSIAWHPTNANIIYVGSASGGLWKTTNGGTSWLPLTDNLLSLAVGAIALDPSNPNTIYIGTGEGSITVDAVYGAGIFKSTDGGSTWNPTGMAWQQLAGRAVNRLVVHPTNSQILWAATNVAYGGGVFKSTDGGTNWALTLPGDARDLVVRSDSVNILYAALGYPWGSSDNGIYRSADGGLTWSRLAGGLPAASFLGRLTLSHGGGATFYTGIARTISAGASLLGIYETTDGGASWTLKSSSPDLYGGEGWSNISCEVSPASAATVYSGGADCYKSTDSGVSWTQKSFGSYATTSPQFAHSGHHALAFKPGDPNTVICVTDGGLFKSTNGGDTWLGLNSGLATLQLYTAGNDLSNANSSFCGAQDNGTARYSGSSWSTLYGGDGGYCNADYTNSNVLYLEMQQGQHFKSTNGGTSFGAIQSGISGGGAWVTPVAMHPANPAVLYTGTNAVYQTTNGGTSWNAISPVLNGHNISTIALAPSNPMVIYIAYENGGLVWKTTNGGANWSAASTGLPTAWATRLAVHPTDPNTVCVTFSGYGLSHVWKSTNGGASWVNISGSLPDVPCNVILFDPVSVNTLYLGTDLGVYRSTNAGATWNDYASGLPNVVVDDLSLHPATGILRAATHGRGLWQTSTTTPPLSVLYPNGGESWTTGATQTILWATGGLGGNVKLELNRAYPAGTWETLIASTANVGRYAWPVSGAASSHARLRISSVESPANSDISNGDFSTVQPGITVLSPNGGEVWPVGSVQTLTWNAPANGDMLQVQINRSYPSFSWTTLTITNIPSYTWTASGTSATTRIRVYSVATPTFGDTSDANFSIINPALAVNYPNGGQILTPGGIQTLRWTRTNLTGNVRVDWNSAYPSGSWTTIADGVSADSLVWCVAGTGSSAARIRVTSDLYSTVGDTSDANFSILAPALTLTSPIGGEAWQIGVTHTVRWTHRNLDSPFDLYVNRNYPAGTWTPFAVGVIADSFAWVVSGPQSNVARVRVVSTPRECAQRIPRRFRRRKRRRSHFAARGEAWGVGSAQTITWNRNDVGGNMTVQVNRTFPSANWETLTTTASGSSFLWTVTSPTTNTARVRISLTSDMTLGDTCDANISLLNPGFRITVPNGGEQWALGAPQTVAFNRINTSGAATVQLKRNYPTGSWENISTNVTDTMVTWTPTGTGSTACRVRVYLNSNSNIADTSNANFSLGNPVLTVTSPNGGELWNLGSAATITWTRANASGAVTVALNRTYPTGAWETLTTGDTASSYIWNVTGPTSAACRIRVTLNSLPTVLDVSNANFSIVQPALSLTAPDGGGAYALNAPLTVRWTRVAAPGTVSVLLNRAYPAGTWELLTSSVAADSFVWIASGAASTACRVKIRLAADTTVSDLSAGNFTLQSRGLTITAPNGGEAFYTGGATSVAFTRTNATTNVTVQLNRSYPSSSWETLATAVSGSSFTWNVSGASSNSARIRVFLTSEPILGDTSDAGFVIVIPTLALTTPNGGEQWPVGSLRTIVWQRSGVWDNVRVELNRSFPSGNWETLAPSVSGNIFDWTVSGAAATTARMRVVSTVNSAIGDTSNAAFNINSSQLTLTLPNGGETIPIGSPYVVRWTRGLASGDVRMLLNRTYPAGQWDTLGTTTADSLLWNVTGPASTTARVKIYLVSNGTIADTSAANFTLVQPSVYETMPHGGEVFRIGSAAWISWSRTGVTAVDLLLNRSYPNGTWESIASNVSASQFVWTISGAPSPACRIKVQSHDNPSVYAVTASNFEIQRASISLTNPTPGDTFAVGVANTLRWNRSTTATDTVRIELNLNYPAGSWVTLDSTASSEFTWIPLSLPTTAARVRLTSITSADVADSSRGNFSILPASLHLTSPSANHVYTAGDPLTVSWTRSNVSPGVAVLLSRNASSGPWDTLASGVTADLWSGTIPGPRSLNASLRVVSASLPGLSDTVGGLIIHQPGLALLSPDSGSLGSGTVEILRCARTDFSGAVSFDVNYRYPGGTWYPIASNILTDSALWTVPDSMTAAARVRVSSLSPALQDVSDSNLTITMPRLVLLAPRGGDSLALLQPFTVRFCRIGAPGPVKVELNRFSPDSGWTSLGDSVAADSFVWNVGGAASDHARLRISLLSRPQTVDSGDGTFRLVQPRLILLSPSAGDSVALTMLVQFSWSGAGSGSGVDIQLKRAWPSGAWETLASGVAGNSWTWTASGAASDVARFRIVNSHNAAVSDTTDGAVRIGQPQLVFAQPQHADTMLVGEHVTLMWSRRFISGNVRVELSRGGTGGPWDLIGSTCGNAMAWTVTAPVSNIVRFRVTSEMASWVAGMTSFNCTILAPVLAFTSPANSGTDTVGSSLHLAWQWINTSGAVRLEVCRDSLRGSWQLLADSLTGTQYTFAVTEPETDSLRFRVTSRADSNVFAITPVRRVVGNHRLVLHVDNSSSTWYIGQSHWISWQRSNCNGLVKVEVTNTVRSLPWTLLAQTDADSFLWKVTGPEADLVALRVTSAQYSGVMDTTATPLCIRQSYIDLLEPNGGDMLVIGQDVIFRWVGVGFSGGVGIALYRGTPANHLDTLFAMTPNDSSQVWHVTGPAASGCLLAIVSLSDTTIFDTSAARFTIVEPSEAAPREHSLPQEFSLCAPFPNPFNSTSTLEFTLPHDAQVSLVIYDLLGREVAVLVNGTRRAGVHRVMWNAQNAGSGTYFVRMVSGRFVATRRLQLIK